MSVINQLILYSRMRSCYTSLSSHNGSFLIYVLKETGKNINWLPCYFTNHHLNWRVYKLNIKRIFIQLNLCVKTGMRLNRFIKLSVTSFSLIILTFSSGFSKKGIQFIENKGQWDHEILFRAEIPNGYLFITGNGLEYLFYDPEKLAGLHPHGSHHQKKGHGRIIDPQHPEPKAMIDMHALSLNFKGRSTAVKIQGKNPSGTYYNYFLGNDKRRWASRVSAFNEVYIDDLYPGIDMKLYSTPGHIKYDLVVDPGADLDQVLFEYRGVENIRLENNSIYSETSLLTLIENTPYAYQVIQNDTIDVDCRYSLKANTVQFKIEGEYDKAQVLTIDPLLVFSTYSGATADNWGNTATYDKYGNVYSGGTVRLDIGDSLPTTPGAYQTRYGGEWDLAILKFDSTGSDLLYGTYLGGSQTETPFSLIVNNEDELVIYGTTASADFPVTDNAYSRYFSGGDSVSNVIAGVDFHGGSDLFIAKLSEDGTSLLASTYLGGSANDGINDNNGLYLCRNYGDEFRGEVITDLRDYIYITGNTSSEDFPIKDGFQSAYGGGPQDALVAKFNADLSELLWSSYLGGSGTDAAYGIKTDPNANVYITGGTSSEDLPVTQNGLDPEFNGFIDGFVAKFSSDGRFLVSGTYLGTDLYDQTYFLEIDKNNDIYVLGQSMGSYPVSDGVYSNPLSGQFIHKLNPELTETRFSTVVGSGSGIVDISPTAFLVNECGNIFLSGWGGEINLRTKYNGGNTFDMPVTEDAFQANTDGSDFYLMVLSENAGELLYGTFLGANTGSGEHVDGGTSRFDKRGIVYHAICACKDGSQFPTTPGVWSATNNSSNCNNGVFKFDLSSLKAAFITDSHEFDNPGVTSGCLPFEVVFLNRSVGGILFEWDLGDGSGKIIQDDSVFHTYENPGVYDVTLRAFDENTCKGVDVARGQIRVFESNFNVTDSVLICEGSEARLEASGAVQYRWKPEEGLNNPFAAEPLASPDSTTWFYINMIDANGCELFDSVKVNVIPEITAEFTVEKMYDCFTHPSLRIENISTNANTYRWFYGDGNSNQTQDSVFTYEYRDPGEYRLELRAALNDSLCMESRAQHIQISDIFIPNIITPNGDDLNETFQVSTDARIELNIFNRWGKLLFESSEYKNNWNAEGLPTGVYYYEIILNSKKTCNGWLQVLK